MVVQQHFSDQKERLSLFYSKCIRSEIPRPLHFCLFSTSFVLIFHFHLKAFTFGFRCCDVNQMLSRNNNACPLKMTMCPLLLNQESLALIYLTVTILLPAGPIPLQSVPFPTILLDTWTLADYNPVFLSSDKSSQSQSSTHMYHFKECFLPLLSFQTIMPWKNISIHHCC